MGKQNVDERTDSKARGLFMKHLLDDVHALELMIQKGMLEGGTRHIGAEQELFIVTKDWHPATKALDVLERLPEGRFTTELAQFNMEINIPPVLFGGDCLRKLENRLSDSLAEARSAADQLGCNVILTGILPTLRKSDLGLQNMTPRPRYFALNEAMSRLRGKPYEFSIRGIDELNIEHDSVMLEACNTSFQLHFQVTPQEFAKLYNIAQLVSPPLLAGATNSPVLFGKRLWRETRIAVFQQAIDTRRTTPYLRESTARVSFGKRWIEDSILEIFKEDIARYRLILSTEIDESPFEAIDEGRPPDLKALCLHNGTIYRWNRPCYGVTDGRPHLRIENRVLPSGPTVLDSIANAAFFFGLLSGFSSEFGDPASLIDFGEVQDNFLAAARLGLNAQFSWFGGRTVPAPELICKELIPLARRGLLIRDIDAGDADHYLGVFEERVKSQRTGSDWVLRSIAEMKNQGGRGERLAALTAGIHRRQLEGTPVHEWDLAELKEAGGWRPSYMRVDQFMRTDLITVNQNDTVDLVANLMDWEKVRHILVEDEHHRLVGLISYRTLLRFFGRRDEKEKSAVSIAEIMKTDPITVTPETTTLEAIQIMRRQRIGCLPILDNNRLAGIVTEYDFMRIASDLLEKGLQG
jgi:CBS domain-containing protein/gamma-glutamylcysteine synthetase